MRQYADLIMTLTQKEVKVRYKNNVLGYLWSIANPLASAMVFYFALQVIMASNVKNYVVFLIIGLFSWQWFSNYLIGACGVFLANGSLIKKSVFPRFVLPIALDLQDTFHYIMSIPVTLVFLYSYGIPMGWSIPVGMLVILPAQFLLLLGLGMAISASNLFFRDMERILAIALNMMFYLSPVIYPIERVPAEYAKLIYLNPMTPLIEAWRGIFLKGTVQWGDVGLAYLYAAIAMAFGIWIYRALVDRFAEVI
ncbi:ABC transporter [Rhodopseudomonas palustris]|uniref:Transport permease protein n=2 Tax=Nitrobacteraceae TaxID=41294 RepID=A0A0D7EX75_RHOPL|nr:ABC transporter [Rhodopseudomonas palustris]